MENVAGELEALEKTVVELGNLVLGIELRRDFITMVQTAAMCLRVSPEDGTETEAPNHEGVCGRFAMELVGAALEVDVGEIPVPDEHPENFMSFVDAFVDIAIGKITAEESGFPYLVEFFTEEPEEENAEELEPKE